jgi:hypothetical protein
VSRSLRRGVTAAFAIVLPIAALAACGAGNDAETGRVRLDNASAEVDDIKVQNVNVILPDESEGPAGVSARLFNDGDRDQTLEAIRLPGTGEPVALTPAEGESRIVVPAGGGVSLGGEGNPSAVIEAPQEGGVRLGNAQRLVFDLSRTGDITLHARVVGDTGAFEEYAEYAPTPTPTETPEDTAEEPEDTAESPAAGESTDSTDPGVE